MSMSTMISLWPKVVLKIRNPPKPQTSVPWPHHLWVFFEYSLLSIISMARFCPAPSSDYGGHDSPSPLGWTGSDISPGPLQPISSCFSLIRISGTLAIYLKIITTTYVFVYIRVNSCIFISFNGSLSIIMNTYFDAQIFPDWTHSNSFSWLLASFDMFLRLL